MRFFILLFCLFGVIATPLIATQGAPEEAFTFTPSAYYQRFLTSYQAGNWKWAQYYGKEFLSAYPTSSFAGEIRFLLGEGYLRDGDYDLANFYLSEYLKFESNPKHFEQTIKYKFEIAKAFEEGARKHLFGQEVMPKWVPAREEALALYDEVITTFPRSDIAAEALYNKAGLQRTTKDFKSSIETYQTLIRRFPKHPLAPESYMQIASVYLQQSRSQFPDPAALDLAEINLRKFRSDFPSDPMLYEVEGTLTKMKNTFAKELYETAQYYERVKKPEAAAIYYCGILIRYPGSKYDMRCQQRLDSLGIDMETFLGRTPKASVDKKLIVES